MEREAKCLRKAIAIGWSKLATMDSSEGGEPFSGSRYTTNVEDDARERTREGGSGGG